MKNDKTNRNMPDTNLDRDQIMNSKEFSKYTIEDLKTALRTIDKQRFPERTIEIQETLHAKVSEALRQIQYEEKATSYNNFMPSEVVTSLWLKGIAGGIVLSLILLFSIYA